MQVSAISGDIPQTSPVSHDTVSCSWAIYLSPSDILHYVRVILRTTPGNIPQYYCAILLWREVSHAYSKVYRATYLRSITLRQKTSIWQKNDHTSMNHYMQGCSRMRPHKAAHSSLCMELQGTMMYLLSARATSL